MHNSIPKRPLFDHIDHKMTGFPICECLALRIPFGCPYGCPFQRTYTIDRIPHNIRSFPYHPHTQSHAMRAHAMLVMHKNAQNGFDLKYDYAILFLCTFLLLQTRSKLKNLNKINKSNLKRKVGGRYSTAKMGFFETVFSSFPTCFFTQPQDHTPVKSPR